MILKWDLRTGIELVLGSAPKDWNGVIYTIVRVAMLPEDCEGVRLLHQGMKVDTMKWTRSQVSRNRTIWEVVLKNCCDTLVVDWCVWVLTYD